MAKVIVELYVPGVFDESHLTVSARVCYAFVRLLDLPGFIHRWISDEHQRGQVAHRGVARIEAQANGARADEGDGERKLRVLVILCSGKFSRPASGQSDINLVEGERGRAQVSIPLERPLPRRRVEVRDLASNEIDLLKLLKVLAHVHRVIERCRLLRERGRSEREEAYQSKQPGASRAINMFRRG